MDPIQQNQASAKKSGNTGLIAGIIAIVLVAGGAFAFFRNSNTQNPAITTPTDTTGNTPITVPSDTPATTPVTVNSKYKDGTYSAEGSYQSPGGTETIQVTLVLKNDVVTSASVASIVAQRSQSREFQNMFISNFKQYVVGKNISDVHLSKVSGSSLTSGGFNAALSKIKTQAQA